MTTKSVSTTPLSSLELPPDIERKLVEIRVESVESFLSRVSDEHSIKKLSAYLGISAEDLVTIVEATRKVSNPDMTRRDVGRGALIQ